MIIYREDNKPYDEIVAEWASEIYRELTVHLNEISNREFEEIEYYVGCKATGFDIIYTPKSKISIKRTISGDNFRRIVTFNFIGEDRKENVEIIGNYVKTKNNLIKIDDISNIGKEEKFYSCSLSNHSIIKLEEDEYYNLKWAVEKYLRIEKDK